MADPTTRLQSLAEVSLDQSPLSPSEVRRRGDRLRRRRTGAAALASAACVVAVAVGISVVNGPARTAPDPGPAESPSSTPSPSPAEGDGESPNQGTGTPVTPPALEPTGPREIPGSYPLAIGWSDRFEPGKRYGLDGPNRDLPALEFTACGTTLHDGPARDRLRADWHNIEYYQGRQLTTYADADAAVAAVAEMVALYQNCRREAEPVEFDFLGHHVVTRTQVAGESWAFADYWTQRGVPAMGLAVTHVIRHGRAVLILTDSGHGGVSPDRQAEIEDRIDRITDEATEPIAAMCRFTEAGC